MKLVGKCLFLGKMSLRFLPKDRRFPSINHKHVYLIVSRHMLKHTTQKFENTKNQRENQRTKTTKEVKAKTIRNHRENQQNKQTKRSDPCPLWPTWV